MFRLLRNKRGELGMEEADGDQLAAEAYAEMDAEKSGVPLPKKEEKPVEDLKPETDGTEQADDINSQEVEQTAEGEATPETEADLGAETDKPKEEEQSDDDKITAHAQKHGMTYAEAKEDIEKTRKIIEQFKNDPAEMARAIRNKDREFDKLKSETEKKLSQKPKVFQKMTEDQFRQAAGEIIRKNAEKYLQEYRDRYPAKSEIMSDEAIIEEVIDREWMGYQAYADKQESTLKTEAKKLRDDFIANVSDKRFIPEVKAMLEQIDDRDILSEDWDPQYLVHIAKGKMFDEEIKAAEERGYKRGKEETKILGIKTGGGTQKPSGASSASFGLNAEQKRRAEEMFSFEDGYLPEESHKLFRETYAQELAKDKNFVF